jgi:hypothetical protein
VTEVPLGGLPAGVYTAVVDATVPVVASGTFAGEGATLPDAVIDEHPYDRAWVAGRAVDGAGGGAVALPPLASSAVVLAALPAERGPDAQAAGQSQVVLRGRAADGSEAGQVTVDVPAGATVTLPAADLGADVVAVQVEPGEGADVAWSVLATADDGTSVPGTLVSVLVPPVVGAPVADVHAVGVPVLTPFPDIANARLTFASGAVANITASRVSRERMRKIRLFQRSGYLSLDLGAGGGEFYRMREDLDLAELAKAPLALEAFVERVPLDAPEGEPLRLEFESFLAAVRGEQPVAVSGEDGREALAVALRIVREIERTLPALAGGDGRRGA